MGWQKLLPAGAGIKGRSARPRPRRGRATRYGSSSSRIRNRVTCGTSSSSRVTAQTRSPRTTGRGDSDIPRGASTRPR